MYNENTHIQDSNQVGYEHKNARYPLSTKLMVKALATKQPQKKQQKTLARPKLVATAKQEPQSVVAPHYTDNIPKHWRTPHLTLVPNSNNQNATPVQKKEAASTETYDPLKNPWIMPTVGMVGLAGMFKLFGNRPVKKYEEEQAQKKGFRAR